MLTPTVIETLKDAGRRIKAVMPDVTGDVTINISKDHPDPKVTILAYDVTKEKK